MERPKSRWLALLLAGATLLPGLQSAETSQPPEVLYRGAPAYPYALAKKRINGTVLVEFIIGTDGEVKQAKVVQSSNSGFDHAAISAVMRWRFKPGRKNGKAVNVRAQQSMEFNVPIHRLIYPFELLQAGVKGKVTLGYWLDENDKLREVRVLEASNPIFGQAAAAALADDLATTPPRPPTAKGGMYQVNYEFEPNVTGPLASVSNSGRDILKQLKKKAPEIYSAKELDTPLRPLLQVGPEFPVALRETQPKGEAMVEFFIDREGNAQLPRIVSASHEEFGYAAAQAAGQWQFEPPLRQGKPVVVRVRLPVEFDRGQTESKKDE